MRNAILMLLLAVVSSGATAGLPPCPKVYKAQTWINCIGEETFSNGLKYVGEYRNGKPNGLLP